LYRYDELTFDYNFERYGDNPIKCFCKTSKCGGWIGAAKASDNEVGGCTSRIQLTRMSSEVPGFEPCTLNVFSDLQRCWLASQSYTRDHAKCGQANGKISWFRSLLSNRSTCTATTRARWSTTTTTENTSSTTRSP
jgi:hypothetical protein